MAFLGLELYTDSIINVPVGVQRLGEGQFFEFLAVTTSRYVTMAITVVSGLFL